MRWMLNRKSVFAGVVSLALLLIAVAFMAKSQLTQAQESDSTMRSLFEDVQRSANDPSFVTYVKFVIPPSDDQSVWTVPNRDPQVGVELSDVGDEYVCFNTPSELDKFHQCFAYTNIVSVS